MSRKRSVCADCGEKLQMNQASFPQYYGGRCSSCRRNYEVCITCRQLTSLARMRGSYCVDCRREYDRRRYAHQRAARGVS